MNSVFVSTVEPIRVVIDTNVWVSLLIGKRMSALRSNLGTLLNKGNVRVVASVDLINEVADVIARPKLKKYVTENGIAQVMYILSNYSDFFTIIDNPSRCRDDKDDYLLELSLQSHANYLVTGDDDLLVLGKIGDTAIIPPSAFLAILKTL